MTDPASAAQTAAHEAEDALALLREIGSRRGPLEALSPLRPRRYCTTGDFIFAESLAPAVRARAERLLRHRWTGQTHFDLPVLARLTSRTRADAVLLGARRGAGLRLRAFVFGRSARTLAVQERPAPDQPTSLISGAGFQRDARRLLPRHVPHVIASGTHTTADGRRVLDWVAEELVDGEVVPAAETEPALTELLALLGRGWHGQAAEATIEHQPLRPGQRRRALDGLADLVARPPSRAWPAEVDGASVLARAEAVLTRARPLTVGLTHGDPTVGNVVRGPDGALILIDWEYAGRRMLAHDVVKVLRSSQDPVALVATLTTPASLAPLIRTQRAMPWPSQIAVALLVFGSGWRDRHTRAESLGVTRRHALGLARSVRLVDALLPG